MILINLERVENIRDEMFLALSNKLYCSDVKYPGTASDPLPAGIDYVRVKRIVLKLQNFIAINLKNLVLI